MITTGNTVLITGGSSGIGLALAKRFLQLKNKVIITGRNEEKLQQIKTEFPGIITFQGDFTDKSTGQISVAYGAAIFRTEHPDQ
ncbi:SDR family NAD(P)-dependent oxidoreductase [Niabella sp. W65]|nr:SDR family NAD(P)-dependent oxidoreductase [Niabella sp. W65]MCH7362915.1 SDR family NAD(P)-dependent oxidoreductase [Niabella sp. W65]ULT38861.1 SDR family NAD(P)-dependent oxidoreductase [Niabella sp. I65]